jgi:hypothetical protein
MDPFKIADRYIQLHRTYTPRTRGESLSRINELILTPLITITCLLLKSVDMITVVTTVLSTYRAWSGWLEYMNHRFLVQRMYLEMMATGGPQIVTNDPEYLPYVFADAVVRANMRRQGSASVRQRAAPLTSTPSSSRDPETPHR